jgi:Na+/H+-dicarboxylate symporter
MLKSKLTQVFLAIALAIIAGLLTGTSVTLFGVPFVQIYGLIGQLFLNALTLVVVPLVVSSIIMGTARMGGEQSVGTLGKKTFGYYFSTSFLAVLVGWAVVSLIKPGVMEDNSTILSAELANLVPQEDTGFFPKLEMILTKFIPSNIIAAAAQGQMLGLIVFSLLFGFFLSRIGAPQSEIMKGCFQALFQIMMLITTFVMKALPVGVFGLVAKVVATTGLDAFKSVGWFFLTVILGLAIYMFIVLPLILKWVAKVSPLAHIRAMTPALITAFTTSSSSATLPVTMECIEMRAGISNRICSFTIPLGTSINMAGSALFQCAASLFIAQVYGIPLPIITQILVVFLAWLVSIGNAGIPSACLIGVVIILQIIGLPADAIGLILAVERILDMARSSVNVFSNSCCTVLVARSEGEKTLL